MKRADASEFPRLKQVFSGYLHEDFLDDYATPGEALRAFQEEADETEHRQFRKESQKFLERTKSLELRDVRALLSRLGCRWIPPSRKALVTLLSRTLDSRPSA